MNKRVDILELGILLIDEATSIDDWFIKFIDQCENKKNLNISKQYAKEIFNDILNLEIPIKFNTQLQDEKEYIKEKYSGKFDLISKNETFEEYVERIQDIALTEEIIELYKQAIERYEILHNINLTLHVPNKLPYNFLNKESLNRLVPSEVRKAVWNRASGKCESCGSIKDLEYDHVIPISKGGSNTIKNIQVLCRECNRKKSNKIE